MARAWRRTVTEEEVSKFVGLFREFRSDFETFEEAMQEVLATVIASPDFLYLTQTMNDDRKGTERISDMEFATRLSFFLWASIPDVELLGAAYQGDLRKPEKRILPHDHDPMLTFLFYRSESNNRGSRKSLHSQ